MKFLPLITLFFGCVLAAPTSPAPTRGALNKEALQARAAKLEDRLESDIIRLRDHPLSNAKEIAELEAEDLALRALSDELNLPIPESLLEVLEESLNEIENRIEEQVNKIEERLGINTTTASQSSTEERTSVRPDTSSTGTSGQTQATTPEVTSGRPQGSTDASSSWPSSQGLTGTTSAWVTKDWRSEELEQRAIELIGEIENAVKTLVINPNSSEEDIESLRFEEDAIRSILKELQKPDISTRILGLLTTKFDDIESETRELLKKIINHSDPVYN